MQIHFQHVITTSAGDPRRRSSAPEIPSRDHMLKSIVNHSSQCPHTVHTVVQSLNPHRNGASWFRRLRLFHCRRLRVFRCRCRARVAQASPSCKHATARHPCAPALLYLQGSVSLGHHFVKSCNECALTLSFGHLACVTVIPEGNACVTGCAVYIHFAYLLM